MCSLKRSVGRLPLSDSPGCPVAFRVVVSGIAIVSEAELFQYLCLTSIVFNSCDARETESGGS